MKTPDTSKKAEEEIRVTPVLIKKGQVFYQSEDGERDVESFSPKEFDDLALSFVSEIDGVKRGVWDVFARAKFLNWLVSEGDMRMEVQANGRMLLSRSVIFISDSGAGNGSKVASEGE